MDRATADLSLPCRTVPFAEAVRVWTRVAALNLAVWLARRVLLRQMSEVRRFCLSMELPSLSTVNVASAVLTLAAAVAAFRFKVGVIPLLLGCPAAGVLYYLLTGANPAAH